MEDKEGTPEALYAILRVHPYEQMMSLRVDAPNPGARQERHGS